MNNKDNILRQDSKDTILGKSLGDVLSIIEHWKSNPENPERVAAQLKSKTQSQEFKKIQELGRIDVYGHTTPRNK